MPFRQARVRLTNHNWSVVTVFYETGLFIVHPDIGMPPREVHRVGRWPSPTGGNKRKTRSV